MASNKTPEKEKQKNQDENRFAMLGASKNLALPGRGLSALPPEVARQVMRAAKSTSMTNENQQQAPAAAAVHNQATAAAAPNGKKRPKEVEAVDVDNESAEETGEGDHRTLAEKTKQQKFFRMPEKLRSLLYTRAQADVPEKIPFASQECKDGSWEVSYLSYGYSDVESILRNESSLTRFKLAASERIIVLKTLSPNKRQTVVLLHGRLKKPRFNDFRSRSVFIDQAQATETEGNELRCYFDNNANEGCQVLVTAEGESFKSLVSEYSETNQKLPEGLFSYTAWVKKEHLEALKAKVPAIVPVKHTLVADNSRKEVTLSFQRDFKKHHALLTELKKKKLFTWASMPWFRLRLWVDGLTEASIEEIKKIAMKYDDKVKMSALFLSGKGKGGNARETIPAKSTSPNEVIAVTEDIAAPIKIIAAKLVMALQGDANSVRRAEAGFAFEREKATELHGKFVNIPVGDTVYKIHLFASALGGIPPFEDDAPDENEQEDADAEQSAPAPQGDDG